MRWFVVVTAFLLAAFGSAPAAAAYNVHYTLLETPGRALPKKMVILPVEVTVREMSAGGVLEKVPEWTREASQVIQRAVEERAQTRTDFTLVPMPQLSAEEDALVDEYLATYLVVALTAHSMTKVGGEGWAHKGQGVD